MKGQWVEMGLEGGSNGTEEGARCSGVYKTGLALLYYGYRIEQIQCWLCLSSNKIIPSIRHSSSHAR